MSSGCFVIAFKLKLKIFLGRHISLQTVLHKTLKTPCLNAYRQFCCLCLFFFVYLIHVIHTCRPFYYLYIFWFNLPVVFGYMWLITFMEMKQNWTENEKHLQQGAPWLSMSESEETGNEKEDTKKSGSSDSGTGSNKFWLSWFIAYMSWFNLDFFFF